MEIKTIIIIITIILKTVPRCHNRYVSWLFDTPETASLSLFNNAT